MSIPISKTLDEIRTELYDRINDVQDEYAAKGWLPNRLSLNKGVARGLIEIWAWGLYQLYQFLMTIFSQAFPETATGLWLDLHCSMVDVSRKATTKAKGNVWFMRTGSTGNVSIPAGRIVKTKPDGEGNIYRFVTTESAVLPDGGTEVSVAVESEEYGQGANVTAGQISEISTTIPGVDSVENRSDWLESEGADAETDDRLRERYSLKWMENNGVTKYAYMSWALGVTGVVAVKIADQHPRGQGTVDIIIKGTAGIPTQDLLDSVETVIAGKAPINDDYLVKAPTGLNVTIDAELELVSGSESGILADAENRLRAMFEDPSPVPDVNPLQIGEDLTMDRLVSVIMAVEGIKKINWTSPIADIQVDDDDLAVLNSLNLTATWSSEE
ncbi:MAG: baseplate J/gp47 family protein [Desulfobacterales bacterium]|nr:baseplate J/gp47 family protein [Desulfobacterales bacterium]